jgi:hypothetical protein
MAKPYCYFLAPILLTPLACGLKITVDFDEVTSTIVMEDGGRFRLEPPGSADFDLSVIAAGVCVCLAALAAGLTMGLMSLDDFQMHIIMESDPNDCRTGALRAK